MYYQVILRCLPEQSPHKVVKSFIHERLGVLSKMGTSFVRPMDVRELPEYDQVVFTLEANLDPVEHSYLRSHLNTNDDLVVWWTKIKEEL